LRALALILLLLVSPLHGETLGIRNSNPGNIQSEHWRAWPGSIGSRNGYLIFKNDRYGLRAIRWVLLRYRARGINTPQGIVERWTGLRVDQGAARYLQAFDKQTYMRPGMRLDLSRPDVLATVARGIIFCENSGNPYPEQLYRAVFLY